MTAYTLSFHHVLQNRYRHQRFHQRPNWSGWPQPRTNSALSDGLLSTPDGQYPILRIRIRYIQRQGSRPMPAHSI